MNSRTSILLALSTGMIVGIIALPMLPKGKQPAAPAAQPASAVTSPTVAPMGAKVVVSPAALALAKSACVESVDGFLGALSSGNRELYQNFLTPLAIAGLGPDQGLSIDGTGIDVYQVGEASIEDGMATVPVAMTIRGQLQNMDLHLREEAGAWSIFGTSVKLGSQSMMINFEGGPNSMEMIAEEMLEGIGEQLAEGMQEAMQGMAEGLAEGLAEGMTESLVNGEEQSSESMSEPLLPLEFDAESPVGLDFVGFVDRSDPQFTRVEVRIENRSNKDVNKVEAIFHYLDADGQELDFFPHSLNGSIGFKGQAPLATVGDQRVNNVTAFFMPEGTHSLSIELVQVIFQDQSSWSAEQ